MMQDLKQLSLAVRKILLHQEDICVFVYTNDSKVLFPSVKEIIRRLKIVASGERLTDQDAEYFDWEEYGSLEMQRIYFSEIIKREAKTT